MNNLLESRFTKSQNAFINSKSEEPIRAELFSVERLEQFAVWLAGEQKEVFQPKIFPKLLPRLEDNGKILIAAYRSLAEAIRQERAISPAAEWLVDNFHIIEEQLREIREDLPKSFYRELPKLRTGDFERYPRIYAVAVTIIAHTDSRLEVEILNRFFQAYQTITPLTIGELWASAISLRLALVENLRRLAARIVVAREEREEADTLADEILEFAAKQPDELMPLFDKRLGKQKIFGHAFVAQIARRLREQDSSINPFFDRLEKMVQKQGENIEQIVQSEHQRQAATQVTVGNIITSMRLLSTLDWRKFFENVSLVDPILRRDPPNIYAKMDFKTRDRYRGVIEKIAKRTKADELEVAEHAVKLAQKADANDDRKNHVGFYLIDDGLAELENKFNYRPVFSERHQRLIYKYPTFFYLGAICFLPLVIVGLLAFIVTAFYGGTILLAAFILLSLIPASDLAVSLVNLDVTYFHPPRLLPRMDARLENSPDAQTFVVIPTLFPSVKAVEELLEKIEVEYLANQRENIYFALLSDFADAPNEEMPDDEAILTAAIAGIEELNKRHQARENSPFYFFHRRRLWNESEGKWIGWERKRGKLHEFNQLLRGAEKTSFIVNSADKKLLEKTKYVITLDSDTQMPRDVAAELVGVIEHPLNHPRFDKNLQRVVKGYGVLQPRVGITLTSSARSRFARIFSNNAGIDPYTTAASDVYQDLFGEGSFTGKGLYVVDAFEKSLAGRVPENSILSHDLYEGLYARCGLVSDIEIFDDFPTFYDSFARRAHRWVRGDWQIARWIFPFVRNADGQIVRNRLPVISRWKILDNLRRSLVAPTIFLWLLAVWTFVPGIPFLWMVFIFLVLGFPIYAHLQTNLLSHPKGISWASHFRSVWEDFLINTAQVALSIVCIAHQAFLKTDAIIRTIYRKLISRRKLLEWTTAAQAESGSEHDLPAFLRQMWTAVFLAMASFLLVLWFRPSSLDDAAGFLVLWFLSPFITYRISRVTQKKREILSAAETKSAHLIARRTWRFFETFVGDADNWLPPDNFQETPAPVIAHRTSPTNIGLLLLATAAARDFGYVGTIELAERLGLTFKSLEKMERFRGHFLNWYDTQTLAPLAPRYVSTVDSGNLAGHLLAVKQSIIEIENRPLFDYQILAGIADTVELMNEEAKSLSETPRRTDAFTNKQLRGETEKCREILEKNRTIETPAEWFDLLTNLQKRAEIINDTTGAMAQELGDEYFDELRFWSSSLLHQTKHLRRDLETFLPWAANDFLRGSKGSEHEKLFNFFPSLAQLPELYEAMSEPSAIAGGSDIENAAKTANQILTEFSALKYFCETFFEEMDFGFLLDKERKVFVIGYNVEAEKPDNSFYDLLASESRLASFVAIAKGEIPQEHWFRLGRPLTPLQGSRALISWTATMFEYLMPILVMRDYDETLLDQTYKSVVARQIEYAGKNGVPWGISEAAYNARDLHLNYQYAPFGIPGLGLKRGLSEDLVISPYSTALAAQISPIAALKNFAALSKVGALARFGFYESIDYTPERLPPNQNQAIIRAFMAHHQGMIFVALDNVLRDNIMQKRFHSEPLIQATELLLQERIPRGVPAQHPRAEEVLSGRIVRSISGRVTRIFDTPTLPTPRTQILSNGKYSVMMTNSGAGYSMCGEMAVTRWREDATCDDCGAFIYLRDVTTNAVWSSGFQPTRTMPKKYEAAFSEDKIAISRSELGIKTRTEIIVSPEDNAEIRRVSITNHSSTTREIEVTSYAEIVLTTPAADAAHPAFSNLSITTEFFAAEHSLIATRRPRAEKDEFVCAVHTVATSGETVGAVQYETDRARFTGRGHDTSNPIAIIEDRPLSNTVGAVLDPIFSLRRRVKIEPRQTVSVSFSTAVAESYEEARRLADKYHEPSTFEREASLAWTRSQIELRHLNLDAEDAHLYQRLAARILYSDPSLRPGSSVLELNARAQTSLWAYGISGDIPIVLTRISRAEDLPTVRGLLHAHEYLRLKNLKFDLVILNDHPTSYIQSLQDELVKLAQTSGESNFLDKNGGVFLRRSDQIPDADRILLHTAARAVIVTERGTFDEQILQRPFEAKMPKEFVAEDYAKSYPEPTAALPELTFFNGLGGFAENGKEYITLLSENQWTPAPWINVIANEHDFGFQVSEAGSGFTWAVNSRENRLTPWSNDPVSDPAGEAIYLRDEDTGTVWTPTPLPIRETEPYAIKHGQGYSVFEHLSHGIAQELLMFVPLDAPVKISLLRLHNRTNRKRRISITSYNELVLGFRRGQTVPFIITETDGENIYAKNPYNNEFAEKIAFAAMSEKPDSLTCDRKEFIGRNRSLKNPESLHREKLSCRSGAKLDPCAALQIVIELEPDETREIAVLLGETDSKEVAREIINRFRRIADIKAAFEKVINYWNEILTTIEVKTPDAALDTIVNHWLLYQSLVCRIWARSAFYQSGGAFGFRDQLQDVMSLIYAKPELTRAQILLHARHQFKEGDVQHWWHPPTGRGVRTHFSDDLLWLPFVTAFYVKITGDESILDEVVPFIEAPLLEEGADDSYTQPIISEESATIFEHCARAIDKSLKVGKHDLPLMGVGDWNDGMSSVGDEGKGESIWVGWFLLKTIEDFLPLMKERKEKRREKKYLQKIEKLKIALDENGWDGDWFRRAYFDDGTPLGSTQNAECRIDSIAQSWSVISDGANPQKAARAMASVDEYLIRRGDGIVLLFTPPFDKSDLEPGYIKGYVPGVRENGGQYTHAALWTLIAYTMLGDGDKAGELFALLNPINHSSTRAGLHKYKVEPYVAAGDVYAESAHVGRGGWTWYTGSAGWMYRAAVESILGFHLSGNVLKIEPCIPRFWREYEIKYRHGKTLYNIKVENPLSVCRGVVEVWLDNERLPENIIPLADDEAEHQIRIVLGAAEMI
ncbi:MAG: GH36-type glycosyl hydrolase domain-containing protein [Pyrinomonadaceae bacterium]